MKTLNFSLALLWLIFIHNTKTFFRNAKSKALYFVKDKYYSVINFRKSLKFKKYEKTLQKALIIEELSQAELMQTIKDRIINFYPKSKSEYIPLTWKQKREIRAAIKFEFGEQMKKLKINVNKDLKLSYAYYIAPRT